MQMEQIIVGNNTIFYRGTGSNSLDKDISELGVWFSDSIALAKTYAETDGYIVTARLQAKRPVSFSANREGYNAITIFDISTDPPRAKAVLSKYLHHLQKIGCMDTNTKTLSTDEIWKALREKGYDAVIIKDIYEGHSPQYQILTVTDIAIASVKNVIESSIEQSD